MTYDFIEVTDDVGKVLYLRHGLIEAVGVGVSDEHTEPFTRIYIGTGYYKAAEEPAEIITRIRDAEALQEMEKND